MGFYLLLWHYYTNDWKFDKDITHERQGSPVFTYEANANLANLESKMAADTVNPFQNGGWQQ
jgi:hypothetical protein